MSRLDEIRARLAAVAAWGPFDCLAHPGVHHCGVCYPCVAAAVARDALADVERLTGEAAAERPERLIPEQLWKHHLAASYSVEPGATWQHVRTGAVYEVLGVALREADCAPLVLYRLRDDGFVNPRRGVPTWARPVDEFLDGRFVRVDE